MIEAAGLSWAYGTTTILEDVDVTSHEGRVLGLIGPYGSGKTTLLRMLYSALRGSGAGSRPRAPGATRLRVGLQRREWIRSWP